jgi:hypothetical protein
MHQYSSPEISLSFDWQLDGFAKTGLKSSTCIRNKRFSFEHELQKRCLTAI